METVVMQLQDRQGTGSRQARRLRKQGLVPAVLYGHKEATESVALKLEDLDRAIRQGARVVDLDRGGKKEKALIKDLQWDALGMDILHVDFARVSADERIELEVKLELRGTAPGLAADGVLVQPLHALTVECSVIAVPESIRVNVGNLQIDQAIHVRDLTLPEGVVAKDDPDAIVVQVMLREEEAEEEGAEGTAEPEVIGRQKEQEEGEGE